MSRKKNYHDTKCLVCNEIFYRRTHGYESLPKYCSRQCYRKSGKVGGFKIGHKINIGKKHSEERKTKISKALIGHKLFNPERSKAGWFAPGNIPHNKGTAKLSPSRILRNKPEYRKWVKKVMCRDKKCVICSSTERLEVDHIKRLSEYPELAFLTTNGRVLCHQCHKNTNTYGGRKNV